VNNDTTLKAYLPTFLPKLFDLFDDKLVVLYIVLHLF